MSDNCYLDRVYTGLYAGIDRQANWTLTRIADAEIEPVTVAEQKIHSRIDTSVEDSYLGGLITAARMAIEEYTGRALIEQSWELRFSGWMQRGAGDAGAGGEFRLYRSPAIAVDSLYYDVAGVATLLAASSYVLDGAGSRWPRILPAYGSSWAGVRWDRPVVISFRAGFARRSISPTEGSEKVPGPLKLAIMMLVSYFYDHRMPEDVNDLPTVVKHLCNPFKSNLGLA